MSTHDSKLQRFPPRGERFATTHWSVVLSAGSGRSPEAGRALASLCEDYWFPLYAFVRRAGYSVEDAQDLTQEFFTRLLAQRFLTKVDREKGKFRSFLLAALKHFLSDQWDRARAQRRGGTRTILSTASTPRPATDWNRPPSSLFAKFRRLF
jgi:RNA polymerase sigma-70 factor (ECF subfamily)